MKEPVRIAHIMGKCVGGGGVESVVMNYYKNIDKNKIQFDFICDQDSPNIPYEAVESLGGKIILIPPYQKIFSYRKELKNILKNNHYKIIHSHINTLSVFPLSIAKKVGIPIRIAHSHSTTTKKEWKRNFLKQILRPFSKKFATHYFGCSKLAGTWQFGKKEWKKGNILIVNNAIDVTKFQYHPTKRKEIRKELKIREDTIVIGHIGRFVTVKNHIFLLEIFKEIHKINKNSLLLLAGDGPLLEQIKSKATELEIEDSILFLGLRKDADRLYQAFDIFVLPSLYEGLPVVGVEAQAAGLPCFLSSTVTKETKILDTTKFISLKQSSREWAEIILKEYSKIQRKNTSKELSQKGFYIELEAKKLQQKYLNLLKENNLK